jgi:hypothetical protein
MHDMMWTMKEIHNAGWTAEVSLERQCRFSFALVAWHGVVGRWLVLGTKAGHCQERKVIHRRKD